MKKFKQIFPSRNYITVDTFGETEVIFNPVGDGFEGDDKLLFRKGRWAFRVNDFLAGKTLPNGENEKMNRKVYSLGIVWDSADNEPIINTTYVDPTSVIPLDGSLVEISNTDYAKETTLQSVGGHLSAIKTSLTTLFDVPLSTRASEATLRQIHENINTKAKSDSELLRINRLLLGGEIYDVLKENLEIGKFFRAIFSGECKSDSNHGSYHVSFSFEILLKRTQSGTDFFQGSVLKVFLFQPHGPEGTSLTNIFIENQLDCVYIGSSIKSLTFFSGGASVQFMLFGKNRLIVKEIL